MFLLYHLLCVLCKVAGLIFKMQGYGFGKCEFIQFAESFPEYLPKVKLLRLVGEVARRAGGVSRPRCHSAWRTKESLCPHMVNKWLVSLQGWTVQTYRYWANNGFENGNIHKLEPCKMWMLYR